MPDLTQLILALVGVTTIIVTALGGYIVVLIRAQSKITELNVSKEALIVALAAKADANAAAIIATNSDVKASLLRELENAKALSLSNEMITELRTANAQLKLANTQMTKIIHQNSLMANPSDPAAANTEHAENTEKDRIAAIPAA